MFIGGLKKGKSKKQYGGDSLNPSNYPGFEAGVRLPPMGGNAVKSPLTTGGSTQVGGGLGYGYSNGGDAAIFGGSYAPFGGTNTSTEIQGRGGNNISAGLSQDGGGRKYRRKRMTKKKWWQRGCSSGGKRTKRSRSTKRTKRSSRTKRRSRRKMRGGMLIP